MRRLLYVFPACVILMLCALWGLQVINDPGSDEPASIVDNPAAQLAQGAYLVRAGDCMACHTMRGGQSFAGGRKISTPFGNLYSPNITPDRAAGIGRWTSNDFWKALHNGKDREGHFLYPAFPYPNYTLVTRADSDAMFVYLKTIAPSSQLSRQPALDFPYNYRFLLAAWRALYFRPGTYQANAKQSPTWNRGAYLVSGLGHCGACHTQHNSLGSPDSGVPLGGALIPVINWYAPSLRANAAGVENWTDKERIALLKTGISPHATVFGPMALVVRGSLQYLSNADLAAMTTYLQSLPPTEEIAGPAEFPVEQGDIKTMLTLGAKLYGDHCVACHQDNGRGLALVYPPLAGNRAITTPSSVNAIRMVLNGGIPPGTSGNPRPYSMPPYGQMLSDREIAAVTSYIRRSWGNDASLVAPQTVNLYRAVPNE